MCVYVYVYIYAIIVYLVNVSQDLLAAVFCCIYVVSIILLLFFVCLFVFMVESGHQKKSLFIVIRTIGHTLCRNMNQEEYLRLWKCKRSFCLSGEDIFVGLPRHNWLISIQGQNYISWLLLNKWRSLQDKELRFTDMRRTFLSIIWLYLSRIML